AVDAPVDAREGGGELVDHPVDVVDAALKRDCEVDQVDLAVAAEQHLLRATQRLELPVGRHRDQHGGSGDHDRAGGDVDSHRWRSLRAQLAEREDHRVLLRVVVGVLLLRHRLDVHLHDRARRELNLAEVTEHDLLLLARVDQVDRLRLDDRSRALLDRQRDLDPHLLRVAGVLDRHREPEVGGRRDRVLTAFRELVVPGQRLGRDDARAVQAGARAAAGGCALEPLEDRLPEPRARVVRVRDEVRVRDGDAGDPLAAELVHRRVLEQVVPDDVARDEPLRLPGEQQRVAGDVLGRQRRLLERVGEAGEAADAELERLDRVLVLDAERAGRRHRARGGDVLLLLLGEAGDPALQVGGLDPLGRQGVVQLPADLLRVLRDRPDLLHVAPVRALLARALAAGDPEDEEDDDQDREGDQAGESEQRGETDRWTGGGRAPRRRPARRRPAAAGARPLLALGGLARLRVFVAEEVEFEVGVVLGHEQLNWSRAAGRSSPRGSLNSGKGSQILGNRRSFRARGKRVDGMAEAPAHATGSGLVLGRYRPLRPLGSGGMGSVWHARDEKRDRDVALKIVPRTGTAGPRAEREAAAAAHLRHPACVRAYSLARDEGHVYIAYEYLPGRTFRHALSEGRLDDEQAVEAAAQVLEGLAHAHEHGIVHRDVKPSNVLLVDGPGISARLLDFGLALMTEEETLTAAGDVPGTLAYISPERLVGKEAGPPTDVWSVGVMLWEALARRHPFGGGRFLEVAKRIGRGAPSLATARPDLPRALIEVVDRALALDPVKRPTAARLAADLRRAVHSRDRHRPAVRLPDVRRALQPAPALPAALFAGWTSGTLPFFPAHWSIALAVLAGGLSVVTPRLGLAFALAVPVLPLGNVSLGLAIVYGIAACGWFALFWSRPRTALLFVAGPLLAPIA